MYTPHRCKCTVTYKSGRHRRCCWSLPRVSIVMDMWHFLWVHFYKASCGDLICSSSVRCQQLVRALLDVLTGSWSFCTLAFMHHLCESALPTYVSIISILSPFCSALTGPIPILLWVITIRGVGGIGTTVFLKSEDWWKDTSKKRITGIVKRKKEKH